MKARNGAAELPEATMPVGQLAQFPLQIQIEFIDDARIEPYSRHKNEMTARLVRPVERTQRDAHRRGVQKLLRGVIGPIGETDFVGQNIGGPGRQDAKRDMRPGESIHSLVDGAVTARGQDEIAALLDGFTSKLSGRLRAGSRHELDMCSGIFQDTDRVVQTYATSPSQATSEGVVDDSDTMG
jgi:hypothetical protein